MVIAKFMRCLFLKNMIARFKKRIKIAYCMKSDLHNLKDIMVIGNRAKFHLEIHWMKGYTLRVKFVFWSAAIKVTECEKNESRRALTS